MASRGLSSTALTMIKQTKAPWSKQTRCMSLAAANFKQTLLNTPPTKVSVLDNGMKVASEDTGAPTATVGVFIDTGSRHEATNGVANFLEHMVFKGTAKRSQAALEAEVANMGGQLTASTGREQTSFSVKCHAGDLGSSVEILSDIIANNTFGEAEVEREKGVILREMQETEGDLKAVAMDHLHSVAYQGTPLARTVVGPSKNVKSMTLDDLANYKGANFQASRMVLAGSGGVDHADLVALAEKHFAKVGSGVATGEVPIDVNCRFTGSDVRVRDDDMPLAHVAIAVEGAGWSHPDNIPLMLASAVCGNWDKSMGGGVSSSAPLAKYCAAKNFCHSFESFNISYKDTGLWGMYFCTDSQNQSNMIYNIQHEWMRICTAITDFELTRVKAQLKTNLLLGLDGTTPACSDIGQQMLSYGKRMSQDELVAKIDAVDAALVQDTCYKYIYDRCIAIGAVGPIENLPDYNRIRAGMYWLRL